jgi:hypothetical protein
LLDNKTKVQDNKFNFDEDLKQALHSVYKPFGLKIPIKTELREMLLDFLTIEKKLIIPKPREVFYNPTLKANLLTHPKSKEILLLAELFRIGKNVNFFQSKKLFQTSFHDHLLYEWNIFHFHLSLEKDKKSSFVKQTNQLLFVYLNDTKAIFLDVGNHLPGIFADAKWLEILHDNFPEIIEPYKDSEITKVMPDVDAIGRQQLWDKGYSIGMTEVRDKVYHSEGVGRTTSGHSVLVLNKLNEIWRWLHKVNEQFSSFHDQVCNYLKIKESEAEFKLVFGQRTLEIIEKTTNELILTYPDILNLTEEQTDKAE